MRVDMNEKSDGLYFKVERIYRLPDSGPMKAFVDLNVNDVLVVKGLRVVQGGQGLFVSFPQSQGKDKKWYDSVRCLNPAVRDQINESVLMAYREQV